MLKNQNDSSRYYFSGLLKGQLAKIPEYFLTVVEAPSGFGKTTAVREYFAQMLDEPVCEKWYTCLGESPAKAWAGICELFRDDDNTTADDLLELGTPTPDTALQIAAILAGFECSEPTCCIIDNYQLFDIPAQKKLVAALSACQNPDLHIIVITQPLADESGITYQNDLYHHIDTPDFFFDDACIVKYCDLADITITDAAIAQIQGVSDGWIAAIRLQLQNYRETGLFVDAKAIGALVETAVWHKLSGSEREFLLGIALLDGFTARQAAIMCDAGDSDVMPGVIAGLMAMDFFVRYIADKKVYVIHAILRDFLLERFAMQSGSFIDAMHRKAAEACVAGGDYFQAARFFMKVADYDAILSLPFTSQFFYNNKESDLIGFFERLVDECPRKILQKHLMMSMLISYLFMRNGAYPAFSRFTEIIRERLDNPKGLTVNELAQAKAEFAILLSFTKFNDIVAMSAYQKEAYDCLKAITETPRSTLFYGTMPWTLGIPSVLTLYWSKVGDLPETLDAMDECLPIYSELAGGHGAGAEIVFRAEAGLAAGEDAQAEALCYKALYRAREARQHGVCLCAEMLLAEIAVLRGDVKTYAAMRDAITKTADEGRQRTVFRMGELCLAVLDVRFGQTEDLPDWLDNMEGIRGVLYAPAMPYGFMVYCHLLLHKQRYAELYGLTDLALGMSQKLNYIQPRIYHNIYLAVAKARQGDPGQAGGHLRDALALALPDKVYLPFVWFWNELRPLLAGLDGEPEFGGMDGLLAFAKRYAKGMRIVSAAISKSKSPLTAREREVAALARERLSAGEISQKLGISVNTVNTILKNVYRKLGINTKAALKNMHF